MPLISDKRAFEGDVVELLDDMPGANAKKGQRGVVITTFDDPSEAYDLELVDQSGALTGFAYSVKGDQFKNLSRDAFVRAMAAVENVDLATAEEELKIATQFRPEYIGAFVNSVLMSFDERVQSTGIGDDVSFVIPLLRLAVRADPYYENARINLAVAFLNFGVAQARKGDFAQAFELFHSALSIRTNAKTETQVKMNIVRACTTLGSELFAREQIEEAFVSFRTAFLVIQDNSTRRNLGLAYGNLGLFYMKKYEFDRAMQLFQRAEDSGVVIADFVNDYGFCLLVKGHVLEARKAFERALEIDPQNESAKINLLKLGASSELSEVLANETLTARQVTVDFEVKMPETLGWQRPVLSSREFAPAA